MATRNYLIGRGELLADPVGPPPMKPTKAHPYTLEEARERLAPQLASAVGTFISDKALAPDDVQVIRLTLHPSYTAKSYFPSRLLQFAGLEPVGSTDRLIEPENHVAKDWEGKVFGTSELFVAGTSDSFTKLSDLLSSDGALDLAYEELREIEEIRPFRGADKVRAGDARSSKDAFELVVHLPSSRLAPSNQSQFLATAEALGVEVRAELGFEVRGLWFLPAAGPQDAIDALSEYSMLRVARPMPKLSVSPITRALVSATSPVRLPASGSVIDPNAKVAILDGGLPTNHSLEPWVESYREMDPTAANSPGYEQHGLAVASAFLFGPLTPEAAAPTPPAKISVFRVIDSSTASEDPYELYKTLGHVEEILLSQTFDFVNLSLGPLLPIEDDEVHAWTSLIDDLLSDGGVLLTVAAGNNGDKDRDSGNARVQVPGDAVNVLTVGAFHRTKEAALVRAPYSAIGPGRSPGRVKPDLLAFGGSTDTYFHVVSEGGDPELVPANGTSLAAPFALRHGVGIRALLGAELTPLAIRGLLLHAADPLALDQREVGWGLLPMDSEAVVSSGDGVARVVYQGEVRPGKYLRAKVPVPAGGFNGLVTLSATFCFASAIDAQSPDAYTRAGLDITFRPDIKKFKPAAKTPTSRPFFSARPYADEKAQRSEQGKWETVLRAEDRMEATTLKEPAFDIHYVARDAGAQSRETDPMRYALIITLSAPKMPSLHDEILAAYPGILVPIEPRIDIDVDAS